MGLPVPRPRPCTVLPSSTSVDAISKLRVYPRHLPPTHTLAVSGLVVS